ncbi:hypothetical protein [Acinetobacter lwoffii]
MKIQQANDVWRNWSGSQSSATRICQPSQISALQKIVGGVLKSMLTLNEAIIDVKEG